MLVAIDFRPRRRQFCRTFICASDGSARRGTQFAAQDLARRPREKFLHEMDFGRNPVVRQIGLAALQNRGRRNIRNGLHEHNGGITQHVIDDTDHANLGDARDFIDDCLDISGIDVLIPRMITSLSRPAMKTYPSPSSFRAVTL